MFTNKTSTGVINSLSDSHPVSLLERIVVYFYLCHSSHFEEICLKFYTKESYNIRKDLLLNNVNTREQKLIFNALL